MKIEIKCIAEEGDWYMTDEVEVAIHNFFECFLTDGSKIIINPKSQKEMSIINPWDKKKDKEVETQ